MWLNLGQLPNSLVTSGILSYLVIVSWIWNHVFHTLVCAGLFSMGCATHDLYTNGYQISIFRQITSSLLVEAAFVKTDGSHTGGYREGRSYWFSSGQWGLGCSARKLNWPWYVQHSCAVLFSLAFLPAMFMHIWSIQTLFMNRNKNLDMRWTYFPLSSLRNPVTLKQRAQMVHFTSTTHLAVISQFTEVFNEPHASPAWVPPVK